MNEVAFHLHLDRGRQLSQGRLQMTLVECVKWLVYLVEMDEPYSESRFGSVIDGYLAGLGGPRAMFTRRDELAKAFRDAAPISEVSDHLLHRILCLRSA